MGKEKEKYNVPRFISILHMETKVLMWAIMVMGFLLIVALILPCDIPLCKNCNPTFLEKYSNPRGYSIQIRKIYQVNQMMNPNSIHNCSMTNPTTKEIEQENINTRVFRPYGNVAYLFI
jgi:hypothetical protein